MKGLPVDVLSKIVSYTIGEPEYVKIKPVKHWREYKTNIKYQDLVRNRQKDKTKKQNVYNWVLYHERGSAI